MSSLQCALGSSQLARIDQLLERRRTLGKLYLSAFKDITDIRLALSETEFGVNDYWVFGIVLQGKHSGMRSDVQAKLAGVGVGTRPFFWPLHLQPLLKTFGIELQRQLPVAENLGANGFYIPNGLGMTEFDTEYVIEQVRKILV
jgi:perosamine synthetase